ncbi:hypothetical protein SISNIDRAFT_460774 [Sistotremastrum niveocremeum HHB9708]|uniref:BZIP domain-containing protein n=1 Tax=Sistotremastrum niveocremeum HHB9708 TaxID=1314777 RepID=A0A164NDE6_9AGAM|nr:hypothetical protein SISNIDRAFT_460774 [Sistotremastrum niveocremeum HHB9708]
MLSTSAFDVYPSPTSASSSSSFPFSYFPPSPPLCIPPALLGHPDPVVPTKRSPSPVSFAFNTHMSSAESEHSSSASPPPHESSVPPQKKPRAERGERISSKDFIPPDVSGLSKREARLVKNRAAAFLSRQRKREEFECMEVRVSELEADNARLKSELSAQKASSSHRDSDSHTADLLSQLASLRSELSTSHKRCALLESDLTRLRQSQSSSSSFSRQISLKEDNSDALSDSESSDSDGMATPRAAKDKTTSVKLMMGLLLLLAPVLSKDGAAEEQPTASAPSPFPSQQISYPSADIDVPLSMTFDSLLQNDMLGNSPAPAFSMEPESWMGEDISNYGMMGFEPTIDGFHFTPPAPQQSPSVWQPATIAPAKTSSGISHLASGQEMRAWNEWAASLSGPPSSMPSVPQQISLGGPSKTESIDDIDVDISSFPNTEGKIDLDVEVQMVRMEGGRVRVRIVPGSGSASSSKEEEMPLFSSLNISPSTSSSSRSRSPSTASTSSASTLVQKTNANEFSFWVSTSSESSSAMRRQRVKILFEKESGEWDVQFVDA